ncbi:MAG: CARDB domain-containing protein [candidate division WOR-3 bacterium]
MFKRLALLMLLLGAFGFILASVPAQSVLNPEPAKKAKPEEMNWVEIGNKPGEEPIAPPTDQMWIEIGTGTSYEGWPMYRFFNYSTWQGIYLQTEINTAGNIVAMGFNNYSTGGITIQNVSIYMRETTATTLTSGIVTIPPPSPWVLVWQGSWPNTQTGWQYVTFTTPFAYSNTQNLIILIVKGYEAWTSPYPYWYYHSTSPNYRVRRGYSDGSQPTSLSTSYNRPNIRLGFPVAHDVSATTPYNVVNYPVVAGDEDEFWFRVVNSGENDETDIPVKLMVNGTVEQTITIPSLNSGTYLDTFFAWTPPSAGTYTLKFFTDLSTDQNRANDTLTRVEGATYVVTGIDESFEGSFPPTGWVVQNINGGYTWSQSDNYAHTGTYSCRNTADGATYYENNSNDILLSPIVDMSAMSECFFEFYHRWYLEANYDSVIIYYTTEADFDNPNPTWTRLMKCEGNYLSAWQAFSQTLPTSDKMRFMWRFLSDASVNYQGYYLDDVKVWVPANDVGVSEIVSPPANWPPEPVIPKAKVKNYGVNDQPQVDVQCVIRDNTGVEVYNETVIIYDLISGEEREVEFPEFTPSEGVYLDTMRTLLAGDEKPENDAKVMSHSFSNWAEIEVGYDDGVPEAYYWVQYPSGPDDRFAVKITPPAANYLIRRGRFNISASTVPLSFADCGVYPESANIPRLSSPIVSVPNQPTATTVIPTTDWKTVDFGDVAVSGNPNDVFLVVHWPTGSTSGPYVSADASAPNSRSYWSMTPPPGTWNLWTGHDWMMRLVFAVPGIDAGVSAILAPGDTVDFGTSVQPQATVWNYGYFDRTFNVIFQISNGKAVVYADTAELTMEGNSSQNVTFEEWTPTEPGEYQLNAWTELANDMNPDNDGQTGSTFIRFRDLTVVEIVRPNAVEPPAAAIPVNIKISNLGNVPAYNIRAQVIINDNLGNEVYNDFREYSMINPEEVLSVVLTPWIATEGVYHLSAFTVYSLDMNPANDTMKRDVTVGTPPPPPGAWEKLSVEVPLTPSGKKIKSGGLIVYGGDKIYIVKGNNTKDFYAFVPETAPTPLDSVPVTGKKGVKKGTGMVYDGTRWLYFASGTNTLQFWKYDTQGESGWVALPDIPTGGGKALKGGTGMAYVNGFVYLLKGSKTNEFYAFDCANNTWIETLPSAPGDKGYGDGSCLVAYDDNTLYALRGKYNEFYKYDISNKAWAPDSAMPFYHPMWNKKKKVGEGASMVVKEGKIYAFKGNNTKEFWGLTPPAGWVGLDTIPKMPDKKYVKGGGGLCLWTDGTIYALKGNNTTSIWKYTGEYLPLAATLPNTATMEYLTGKELGIRIVPNPTKGLAKVYYNLPKKEMATLRIYNTLGNLVYLARSDKGEFTIKRLPVGIYLLRFESKGYKEDRKLIVVK